jgi:hypothetical protein
MGKVIPQRKKKSRMLPLHSTPSAFVTISNLEVIVKENMHFHILSARFKYNRQFCEWISGCHSQRNGTRRRMDSAGNMAGAMFLHDVN